jgi:hypothetical protein
MSVMHLLTAARQERKKARNWCNTRSFFAEKTVFVQQVWDPRRP